MNNIHCLLLGCNRKRPIKTFCLILQDYFSCKQFVLDMDDDHLMMWALIGFVSIMFFKVRLFTDVIYYK